MTESRELGLKQNHERLQAPTCRQWLDRHSTAATKTSALERSKVWDYTDFDEPLALRSFINGHHCDTRRANLIGQSYDEEAVHFLYEDDQSIFVVTADVEQTSLLKSFFKKFADVRPWSVIALTYLALALLGQVPLSLLGAATHVLGGMVGFVVGQRLFTKGDESLSLGDPEIEKAVHRSTYPGGKHLLDDTNPFSVQKDQVLLEQALNNDEACTIQDFKEQAPVRFTNEGTTYVLGTTLVEAYQDYNNISDRARLPE